MEPLIAGAAKWLLNQLVDKTSGKLFDLAVKHLLEKMGLRSSSVTIPGMQSLLDQYRQQLIARLDEDRIAQLYGALSQLKDASHTVAKQGYLIQAQSTFHVISHLPEQGMTGGQPNAKLRCVAFIGMATAHIELEDQPRLIAEKIIAAIHADPLTAEQWLGKQVTQTILTHYPQLGTLPYSLQAQAFPVQTTPFPPANSYTTLFEYSPSNPYPMPFNDNPFPKKENIVLARLIFIVYLASLIGYPFSLYQQSLQPLFSISVLITFWPLYLWALIRTLRRKQYGWFIAVLLGLMVGLGIYLLRNPKEV